MVLNNDFLIGIQKGMTLKDFIKIMCSSNDSSDKPGLSCALKQGSVQRLIPCIACPNWHEGFPIG